jgi:hypothetical protein
VIASIVAQPVVDRLACEHGEAILLGTPGGAAHIALGDFVVAVTPRGAPLLPNGIAITARRGVWPPAGATVRLSPGRIQAGAEFVTWPVSPAAAEVWDPAVPQAGDGAIARVAERGAAILEALGIPAVRQPAALAEAVVPTADTAGRRGAAILLRAVHRRDPALAALAAEQLTGRGPGLTPRGDDVLAGTACAVACLGRAAGWDEAQRGAWLNALVLADRRRLTTPLSVTLLELAVTGRAMEPVHGVLRFGNGDEAAWRGALDRLCAVGHTSGIAYATAIGASAVLL